MKQSWEIKKLGDIASIKSGKSIDANQISCNTSLYPCYGGNGIRGFVNSYSYDGCFPIIGRVGALCGNVHLAKGRFYATEHALVVKIKDNNINPKWLKYNLISLNLKKIAKGVAQPVIAASEASKISIPVPPIAEQEKIVAELDCLSGIIEKKKQQLKEYDALAQSIFYEMFGNPVDNEKGWNTKRVEEICDVYRGGSPRPIEKFLGGNIPWIKIGDATQGDSIYLTKTKEHIIEEGLKKTRFIHSGSLIFANCGVSLGFARIITFDGCIHDGWLAFDNVSDEIEKIFFLKSINFCTQYFRSIAPDGVQPNLNTTIMKAFMQILPPLELQKRFVEIIKNIEKQKLLVAKSIEEVETLFNSRMDYYFN